MSQDNTAAKPPGAPAPRRGQAFSTHACASFLLGGGFIAMLVSGLVLLLGPRGRAAREAGWTWLDLDRPEWAALHLAMAVLFLLAGVWHLTLNWRAMATYIVNRRRHRIGRPLEMLLAVSLLVLVIWLAVADLPPVSWLADLHGSGHGRK